MQSLGALPSNGAFLVTTQLGSASSCFLTWKKRRKWRFLGGKDVVPGLYLFPPGNLASGFLGNCPKLELFHGRKVGRPVFLALQQEIASVEHFGGDRNSGILSNNGEGEGEEKARRMMNNGAAKLTEKGRIDVQALASRLHDAKTADDVEGSLKDFGGLPLQVYSSMIRGLGYDKKLDAAFAVVEYLKRKGNAGESVAPNLFIYNSLLSAVKQNEQFERVGDVLADMKLRGIAPNVVTYNTLMWVYLEEGKTQEALRVFADFESLGVSPSPVTYATVLLAYKKMDDAFGALGFFVKFRDMYEKGELVKDKDADWGKEFRNIEKFIIRICYLVMRQSLVSEEDPTHDVLKLLNAMDEAWVKPPRTDYERLLWACTRKEHYTVAKELYKRIRECDGEISLSVCNHLIWLMGKAKKWWAALEIYEDLLDKGPRPNNLSYELIISHFNILLTAARRRGIWRWGVRLLNKMQDKGLKPGSREWNAVLVACSKASETLAAVEIFRRMVEQGEKPTVLSYGALLSVLEKAKLYDEALRVWEHMCKVGVKPNLYAYTILASVYISKGNPEMVDSVLHEMLSSRIEPTVVTFNAIITGCAKNNMGGASFEWFHRMKVQNIKPNEITYEMLIQALAQDGKPRLAYEMYLRAYNEGLQLCTKAYDTVIVACRAYGATIDLNALGPRPAEKKKPTMIRKNMSDFCQFADLPRRGRPFERAERYIVHTGNKDSMAD